jgi:hypothetical protein
MRAFCEIMKEFTQPSGKFSLADNLRDLCERFELLSIHQGQQDRQIAALQNELKIHGAVHNYAEKDTIERLCNRAKNLENRFANLEAPFTGIATDIDEICKKLDALALRLFNIEAEIRDMKAEDITKIADGDVPKPTEPDPETFGFMKAVEHMKAGRRVKRHTYPEFTWCAKQDGAVFAQHRALCKLIPVVDPNSTTIEESGTVLLDDVLATDWTLAE